jgi:TatA/E family protein of Tat protein translocase
MGIDNPVHLIFLAAVALIVLGPKRLPDMARSLGHGLREFRESMSEASSGDAHADAPLVPQQAQLVAAQEPVPATPADAVVVDPAAPQQPATFAHAAPVTTSMQDGSQATQPVPAPQTSQAAQAIPAPQTVQPEQATPVQVDAAETVAQPPLPPAS